MGDLSAIWQLRRPALADAPPDIPLAVRRLSDDIDTKLTPIGVGVIAARPPFGKVGQRYVATDQSNTEYLDIGAAWITRRVLGAGAVLNADLADDSVDARVIAPGAVGTSELADLGVQRGDLADSIINAAKVDATLKPSGGAGGGTEALRAIGAGAGQVVAGNDARLTDARAPSAHAATHAPGGTDAIAFSAGRGTFAAMPAASAANAGLIYFATDVWGGAPYRSTGAAWEQIAAPVTHGGLHRLGGTDVIPEVERPALGALGQPGVIFPGDLTPTSVAGGTQIAVGSVILRDLTYGDLRRCYLLANTVVAHAANGTGNPRIDSVVAIYNGWMTSPTIQVVQGTATAGATLDNRNGAPGGSGGPALPANSLLLRDTLHAASAAANTFSSVRDRRPWARGAIFKVPTAANAGQAGGGYATLAGTSGQNRVELGANPIRWWWKVGITTNNSPGYAGRLIATLMLNGAVSADDDFKNPHNVGTNGTWGSWWDAPGAGSKTVDARHYFSEVGSTAVITAGVMYIQELIGAFAGNN